MDRAFGIGGPSVFGGMAMACSQLRRVAWGSALFLVTVDLSAPAQYVPIRALDSNGLLQQGWAVRLSSDVVVGGGTPIGSPSFPGQAALWDSGGTTLLPALSGDDGGGAVARNAAGVIVGASMTSSYSDLPTAVEWISGSPIDINTLVSSGASAYLFEATDVDRKGRILLGGSSRSFRAYVLDGGNLVDLGVLDPRADESDAWSMNDRGVAVGDSAVGLVPVPHACLFANGQVTDLHDPSVMEAASYSSDVNRDGWVVGWSESNPGFGGGTHVLRGFLFDGSHAIDLSRGTPSMAFAKAINDFGVVVGDAWDPATGTSTAVLWQNGVTIDLNTLIDPSLGWHLDGATDIDNEGRICGSGTLNGVPATAYILEPDCKGTFTSYGSGCSGTGGIEPVLSGTGCPAPDRDFAIQIVDGLPGGVGFLVVGTGTGTITVKPGCDLQVLPLVGPILPFTLDSLGELWLREHLPTGTPIFDVNLQAICFDPGAAYGISSTAPIALHFE
jgi:probable HAF family extracellular repeat protein